jgi:hypothetical protein
LPFSRLSFKSLSTASFNRLFKSTGPQALFRLINSAFLSSDASDD